MSKFSAPARWEVRILHINANSEHVFSGTHSECCAFLVRNKSKYRFSSEHLDTQTLFVTAK